MWDSCSGQSNASVEEVVPPIGEVLSEVALPAERRGERPIADDIHGTWLESITLKRKAYWMATILVTNRDDVSPKPDGREMLDFKWHTLPEASQVIHETNHAEKAKLLLSLLDACDRDLRGARRDMLTNSTE